MSELRVRIAIEVVAGLVPGTPINEHTRRFIIPSELWYAEEGEWKDKKEEAAAKCKEIQQQAVDYMTALWNPQYINWVRCDWIYF